MVADFTGEVALGDFTGEVTLGNFNGDVTLGDFMGEPALLSFPAKQEAYICAYIVKILFIGIPLL